MTPPRVDPPKLADVSLEISTARLTLRQYRLEDAEALWPTVSDPAFPVMMSWEAHASIDETRAWIATLPAGIAKNSDVCWAITNTDTGEHIGTIGLHGITWKSLAWRRDRAEIGYWVHPHLAGKGYATEACIAVVAFAFERLGLHKVTIGCLLENVASKRVIEKVGFRFVARIDEDVWRNDRWWTHLRYEITISEWSDISSTLRFSRPRTA